MESFSSARVQIVLWCVRVESRGCWSSVVTTYELSSGVTVHHHVSWVRRLLVVTARVEFGCYVSPLYELNSEGIVWLNKIGILYKIRNSHSISGPSTTTSALRAGFVRVGTVGRDCFVRVETIEWFRPCRSKFRDRILRNFWYRYCSD